MPVVIGIITLASRRWGNTLGGMIGSLPLVAGPILIFFAIEQSTSFAVQSVAGTMTGIIGWLGFCMVYVYFAPKYDWYITVWLGYLAFLITALVFNTVHLPLILMYGITMLLIVVCLKFYPKTRGNTKNKTLKFDIPIRMVVVTIFVVLITALAKRLGSDWSGILTPFPIVTSILAVFTHYTQGSIASNNVLRGMLAGMLGYTTYLFSQGLLLNQFSIFVSCVIGLLINFIINWQVAKVIH